MMPIHVLIEQDPAEPASDKIPSGRTSGRFTSYTEGDPFVESPPALDGGGGGLHSPCLCYKEGGRIVRPI